MSRNYTPEEHRKRIRNCLWRLRKMRELNAPMIVLRQEQLMLWAMRQQRKYKKFVQMSKLPGWRANFEAFVLIHHADPKQPQ